MPSYRSRRGAWALACAAAAVAAALSGCAADANGGTPGTIDVVASTDVWGSVASAVGGSQVSVTSIISDPDQDPHSFEASSRTLLAVRDADVLVENGGGYDDFMPQLISTSGNDAPVVDAVAVSGYDAPPGEDTNEHVWYDLPTVQKVAHAITVDLIHADPQHGASYESNERAFDNRLGRLGRQVERVRDAAAGVDVAITEPLPLYLLEAMGLHDVTPVEFSRAVEDGSDVSPRVLSDTLALFTRHQVAALFSNDQTSGPITDQVEAAARSAGVPVVPMSETLPDDMSYLTWMSQNISRVADAVTRP